MWDILNYPYPTQPVEIRKYLCQLWSHEYPDQGISLPKAYAWEKRCVLAASISCKAPRDIFKAKRYLLLLKSGLALFPPLVCVNGEVIDGMHRYWAYHEAGFAWIDIYQNKPLKMAL